MADLPSAAPQMFQLPGPSQINQQPGLAEGLASGLNQGVQLYQAGSQIASMNAMRQQQIRQSQIETSIKVLEPVLKNAIDYPTLMKPFWPTIATTMNQINPEYKLDPKNPPADIKPFTAGLFDVLHAHTDGVINPQQADSAVHGLINDHIPRPVQTIPVAQPQIPGEAEYTAGMKYIADSPLAQQAGLKDFIAKDPVTMKLQSALEEDRQKSLANEAHRQANMTGARSVFNTSSDEFRNLSDNFASFNYLMQQSRSSNPKTPEEIQAQVTAEKTAFLNYVQMAFAGSKRPANFEMIGELEKAGSLTTLAEQAFERLKKGDILTPKQIKGISKTALDLYQSREVGQTELENTWAANVQSQGIDPRGVLLNHRPVNVVSTSKFFPTQSTDTTPLIGHIYKHREGKKVVRSKHLGGDRKDQNNWAYDGEEQ